MNTQWKTFLQQRGAQLSDQDQVHFPTPEASKTCALCDLSDWGWIEVSGKDAVQFLQGQLTNDVRELSDRHAHLSAHCTPKGRMLAIFRVLRLGDTFLLQLPRSLVASTLQRLQFFVLRAQVGLRDVSDEFAFFGLAGDRAESLLSPHFDLDPARDFFPSTTKILLRIPGPTPRFQLLGPPESMIALWEELEPEASPREGNFWSLLDIRAGLPWIYPETREAWVPQMVNLQRIDGVSFTKGCYTGQEVVARMQYLGKLKRRMYWAEVETDQPVVPGQALHAPSSRSEQATGRVVSAQQVAPDRWELLAVVEIHTAEAGDVYLNEGGGRLRLAPPPYGFDETPQTESA